MIKPIMKDISFLSKKSTKATLMDQQIMTDLNDTLNAHLSHCVGMAANMIGQSKNIIIVRVGAFNMIMVNPIITKKLQPYETEESCLSLIGSRKTKRYKKITVEYDDRNMVHHTGEFEGYIAQIIQHEVDHLSGIII